MAGDLASEVLPDDGDVAPGGVGFHRHLNANEYRFTIATAGPIAQARTADLVRAWRRRKHRMLREQEALLLARLALWWYRRGGQPRRAPAAHEVTRLTGNQAADGAWVFYLRTSNRPYLVIVPPGDPETIPISVTPV